MSGISFRPEARKYATALRADRCQSVMARQHGGIVRKGCKPLDRSCHLYVRPTFEIRASCCACEERVTRDEDRNALLMVAELRNAEQAERARCVAGGLNDLPLHVANAYDIA